MNLDTAAKTINIQQDLKATELKELVYADYSKRNKLWSSLPTTPYTTTIGEGLTKRVHERSYLYSGKRTGSNTLQIRFIGHDSNKHVFDESTQLGEDAFKNVPLPLFSRIREVFIDDEGTMYCKGGCKFECAQCFCEHQACIARLIHEVAGAEFKGFTHHDCGVRYLSGYMQLA